MLNIGIIGTNGISDVFMEAVRATYHYQLHSVLSRTLSKAENFAKKYGDSIKFHDNLTDFLADDELDVVYIATPNSLHFEQAKSALIAKKQVIVEKPAFSNPAELAEIKRLAQENQVYFFEAIRTLYNDGFSAIQDFLTGKEVLAANFRFVTYDYRMAEVLSGGAPPSFSAHYSGGTLTDIGVYLLYPALALFGIPLKSTYQAKFLPTGVDGNGLGILNYGEFQVSFVLGRNIHSYQPQSEIYLTDGTLVIDNFGNFEKIVWQPHHGQAENIPFDKKSNSMIDQINLFAQIIQAKNDKKFEKLTELTTQVNQIMYEMRQSAKLYFDADNKI